MITAGLARSARALLIAVNRSGAVPTKLRDGIAGTASELLAMPGRDAQALRDCGARIGAALLSLEADDLPVTYASARCGRILQAAIEAERQESALGLAIPPVPPEARVVIQ
ncbi:hypothetical protein [Teichococcus aestuarii]|uniref:hypothetical protein n=1 Tax=Teichococcus aestuarii TaxID=568898 RepID=UPI003616BF21